MLIVKNNFEACLILKKLDFASLSKMDNALNPPLNVNMPMGKLNLGNLPTIISLKKIMTLIEVTEIIVREVIGIEIEIMKGEIGTGTGITEIETEIGKEKDRGIEIGKDKEIEIETEIEEIEIETEKGIEIGRGTDIIRIMIVDILQAKCHRNTVKVMDPIFRVTVIIF